MVADGCQIWLVPTAQVRARACCWEEEVGAPVWGAKLRLLFTKGLWRVSVGGEVMGCRWLRMGKSSKAVFFLGGL